MLHVIYCIQVYKSGLGTKNGFTCKGEYIARLGDSDRKQCYKESESASIACHGHSTCATLAGRRGIGTGDIGCDGKVLRQSQVCALREKNEIQYTSRITRGSGGG